MSQSEIAEHAGYLRDRVRMAAYDQALRKIVRPGSSTVLDLGAGTGILGLLAARAGARHVYSVDSGRIIATTEAIARASGFGSRMTFLQELSTAVSLPEPVDIVVCDQIGGMAYDAGVLEYFDDARRRLAGERTVLVPASFALLAAPLAATDWERFVGIWRQQPGGFDLSPMATLAANTEFRVELTPEEFLGAPAPWATIPSDHADPVVGEVDLAIERPGVLNAIGGMFVATLVPGVELSNCPLLDCRFERWQNLYPLSTPVDVESGDRVQVRFDVRPRTYMATWTVTVTRQNGPLVTSRGSTVLGLFMTPNELAPPPS